MYLNRVSQLIAPKMSGDDDRVDKLPVFDFESSGSVEHRRSSNCKGFLFTKSYTKLAACTFGSLK